MEISINNIPDNGDEWEKLCMECYRYKYQNDHFTLVPAVHGGDAGIEAFTGSGIVCQCYCPERSYNDTEYYEHIRDKMTTDLNKLLDPAYEKRLQDMGVPKITEWHYMIPDYRDARILEHAEKKKRAVIEARKAYISDGFRIQIVVFADLKVTIAALLREELIKGKIDVATSVDIDWTTCPSEKISNIRRKIKAVKTTATDNEIEAAVEYFAKAYLDGLSLMERYRTEYPQIHKDLFALQQSYSGIVKSKSIMLADKKMNSSHFHMILDEFGERLKTQFAYISEANICALQNDLVSGWLADCSLSFA